MTESITFHVQDNHIGIMTLNRPKAMNAMSLALLNKWNELLEEVAKNEQIRVLIITAAGEKAFSAGADLKERQTMSEQKVLETVRYIGDTIHKVAEMEIPVIAAINGAAIGGGLELALACDIRIAVKNAKLGLTETSLAIIPGAGGTQRLARLIGVGQAKRLILTSSLIESEEAFSIGLVEQVVNNNCLMEQAIEIATQISENGPISVKKAKQAIDKGIEVDLHSGIAIEHLCYQQTIDTNDRIEGLQAFREKRKPVYTGE